jgi:hypothetical protein
MSKNNESNKSKYTSYKDIILAEMDPYGNDTFPNANAQDCKTLCDIDSECSGYFLKPSCQLIRLDSCPNGFCTGMDTASLYGSEFKAIKGLPIPLMYIDHQKLTSKQMNSLQSIKNTSDITIIPTKPSKHYIEYKNVDITSDFPVAANIAVGINENVPSITKTADQCLLNCLELPTDKCSAVSVEPIGDYYSCQMKNLSFCADGTKCSANSNKNTSTFVRSKILTNEMNEALKNPSNNPGLYSFTNSKNNSVPGKLK